MRKVTVNFKDGTVDRYTTNQSYHEVLADAEKRAEVMGTRIQYISYLQLREYARSEGSL